jgi:hypothetical protein
MENSLLVIVLIGLVAAGLETVSWKSGKDASGEVGGNGGPRYSTGEGSGGGGPHQVSFGPGGGGGGTRPLATGPGGSGGGPRPSIVGEGGGGGGGGVWT